MAPVRQPTLQAHPSQIGKHGPAQKRSTLWSSRQETNTPQASCASTEATGVGASPCLPDAFDYNYDEIARLATAHETFEVRPGYDLVNLPRLYSLENYGISVSNEIKLCKAEIHRLVKVVNSMSPHHLKGDTKWFGEADEAGYARLDKLTMQMKHAWYLCELDNELTALCHAPDLGDRKRILSIEKNLRQYYDPDDRGFRYLQPLSLDSFNSECFHSLVDHLTATIAQILARVASGRFWEENFIAALAKLATKMKCLVLYGLPDAVSVALETKQEILDKLSLEGQLPPMRVKEPETGEKDEPEESIKGKGNQYFIIQMAFHHLITHLCQESLDQLTSCWQTDVAPDVFETSVVIYDTGYWDRRAMICGLRDGGIGGLGDITALHSAQAAFQVCGDLFEETTNETPSPRPGSASGTSRQQEPKPPAASTTLYWHWVELETRNGQSQTTGSTGVLSGYKTTKGQCIFHQMKSVINILVPYQMLGGAFASTLEARFINISTIAPSRDKVMKFQDVRLIGTSLIQTSKFQTMRQEDTWQDKDVCSVWQTDLAQERGLAPRPAENNTSVPIPISGVDLEKIEQKWKMKSKEVSDDFVQFQGWAIDSKSITLMFKIYAWGTLALATILVIGGLLFGFLVGERIKPVDPFNVTMFFWGFAAFLILVCKSYKVAHWDWRDFLLGRIVCRSASEIVGVTGIKYQRLLAMLLRITSIMILQVKGPYHMVFTRKSESDDGFAIDIPLDTKTMAAGGYIFVKVHSVLGPALVGLHLGKWTTYDCVYSKGSKGDKSDVICRDFEDLWTLEIDGRRLPLRGLCTNALKWHRVLGVYKEDAWFD